jgi:galactokinase
MTIDTSQQEMIDSLRAKFAEQFGDTDGVQFSMAPGRVNLLGEYTDLNDGFVLPMTVDRGVYLAVRKRDDRTVRVYSIRYDELIEYELDQCPSPKAGSWPSYIVGVVEELRLRGLVEHGFEAVVDGDLTLGGGLSSSAALEVATATALQQLIGFTMDQVEMVKLCQHVEHSYANVLCGIMDQFASRIGRKDHALFLDCRSLEYKNIPLTLGDFRIVIVDSGVKRSLAASAYNTRRAECQEAVEYFNKVDDKVIALRDVTPEMFEEHADELASNVRRRCRHVVAENKRVLDAVDSLSGGDLETFGSLMNASHHSLRDDFEVSCAELDLLTKLARNSEGVLGARMTGAGFGGCTVNLVHDDAIPDLVSRLESKYPARFDLTPGIFV